MKLTYHLTFAVLIGMMFATLLMLMQRPEKALGQAGGSGIGYNATSTGPQGQFPNWANFMASTQSPTSTPGVLRSVVISKPGTSGFCLYDATSTRTNAEVATSTMWSQCWDGTVQGISGTTTLGTYELNVNLKRGLLIQILGSPTSDTRASTTITWETN